MREGSRALVLMFLVGECVRERGGSLEKKNFW